MFFYKFRWDLQQTAIFFHTKLHCSFNSKPTRKSHLKNAPSDWPSKRTSISSHLTTPFSLLELCPSKIFPTWADQGPNQGPAEGCQLPPVSPVLILSPAVLQEASHAWKVTGCPPCFCRGLRVLPGHRDTRGAMNKESESTKQLEKSMVRCEYDLQRGGGTALLPTFSLPKTPPLPHRVVLGKKKFPFTTKLCCRSSASHRTWVSPCNCCPALCQTGGHWHSTEFWTAAGPCRVTLENMHTDILFI